MAGEEERAAKVEARVLMKELAQVWESVGIERGVGAVENLQPRWTEAKQVRGRGSVGKV